MTFYRKLIKHLTTLIFLGAILAGCSSHDIITQEDTGSAAPAIESIINCEELVNHPECKKSKQQEEEDDMKRLR